MTKTAEITYKVKRYSEHDALSHTWTITGHDGSAISELFVDMQTLEIRNIWTHEDHRGEGHATALWNAAQAQMAGRVRHSHEAHRTDEGSAWAWKVGGETAPCTDDCRCDDQDDDDPWA